MITPKAIVATAALLLSLGAASTAPAAVFSDNFNAETPGGFGSATLTNWDITLGNIDILGDGPNGGPLADFLPGNGYYVDLDGFIAGARIEMKNPLALTGGVPYTLSFSLAGSQRGDPTPNLVTYGVDFDSNGTLDVFSAATLPNAQGFTTINLPFTLASSTNSARIVFDHTLSMDNEGLLLDNVSVNVTAAIPEPSTYALMLAGLGVMGFAARRKARPRPF